MGRAALCKALVFKWVSEPVNVRPRCITSVHSIYYIPFNYHNIKGSVNTTAFLPRCQKVARPSGTLARRTQSHVPSCGKRRIFPLRLSPYPTNSTSDPMERLQLVPKRVPPSSPTSPPLQEADDGVLQPAEDVRRDQGQLAAGQGAVVRRRVLSFAHRQQRDLLALCAGTWIMWRDLKKKENKITFL